MTATEKILVPVLTEHVTTRAGWVVYLPGQRERIQNHIRQLPDGQQEWKIGPVPNKRSLKANNYYWAMLTEYSKKTSGYTPEELHEALKTNILGIRKVNVFGADAIFPNSSAVLSKKDFAEYVSKAELILREYYG